MTVFWLIAAVFLYTLVAAVAVFGLLVLANKHTNLERPWPYVIWAMLWPVAALPALGYIMAGKVLNGEEAKHGEGESED
ncbi:MAG: hypothetical protein IJ448_01330 [Oscillospiraceae bacterium]|nr:hypothetical protein [Oscillospiraceae bacterium]